MDFKLEMVVVPVSDVDRAKAFYEQAGFGLDSEHGTDAGFRVVQLSPPGSACAIAIGSGMPQAEPGTTKGLHLVVDDIEAAHADLSAKGIPVSAPFHFGPEGMTDGPDRLTKGEITKDAIQATAEAAASTVGDVATIITRAAPRARA